MGSKFQTYYGVKTKYIGLFTTGFIRAFIKSVCIVNLGQGAGGGRLKYDHFPYLTVGFLNHVSSDISVKQSLEQCVSVI